MKVAIKTLLTESLFDRHSERHVELLNTFLDFATKSLNISHPVVKLLFTREGLVTTADYGNKTVRVYAKDRALVDIMRSVAHELVHMKQDVENRLTNPNEDGQDGSPIENEANATAGVLIRKFGKIYPEIHE